MIGEDSSTRFLEIDPKAIQIMTLQSIEANYPRRESETSSGVFPANLLSFQPDAYDTLRKLLRGLIAAAFIDVMSPHGRPNTQWIEPCHILRMQKALLSGRISVSPDLIRPREKASESSLQAPSGFLLAWLETSADEVSDGDF